MKFYNSMGPNPRVVRMFLAEKGIELPTVEVDLMGAENRGADYLAKNPFGQVPGIELDDGTFLTEVTAICEYLDELNPGGDLIGESAEARAETRMWARRVDLYIVEPMFAAFRAAEGRQLFESRMKLVSAEAAVDLKAIAHDKLDILNQQMADKQFLCGERFSFADIFLYAMLDFAAVVGQPLNEEFTHLAAWLQRVRARPSAAVSQ